MENYFYELQSYKYNLKKLPRRYSIEYISLPAFPKYKEELITNRFSNISKKTVKDLEVIFFVDGRVIYCYEKEKLYVTQGLIMDENFKVLACWLAPEKCKMYKTVYDVNYTYRGGHRGVYLRNRVFTLYFREDFVIKYHKIFLSIMTLNQLPGLKVSILPSKQFDITVHGEY